MNKQGLIDVFQDTVQRTRSLYTNSETTKHTFSEIMTMYGDNKPNIVVINSDTVSSLSEQSGYGKTCVLNMASYKHPGGGVERGAMAQEECLFRCSTLHNTITTKFYPLREEEALYTTNAIFIKDKYYSIMYPATVDVITIAAVNLNLGGVYAKSFTKTEEYEILMSNKIRLMLSLASKNNCENIILAAWGCGVYKNEPRTVAKLFKQELENDYGFKNVVFAVINDHNSVDSNYEIFKEILGNDNK